jgi:hydroxylysine kinase
LTGDETAQDIATTMSGRFGIPVASVHALGSEFNQTFEVRAIGGDRYVAKVFARDDIDTVRWQHRLMDRIAEVGDVVVPHVLRDSDGHDIGDATADPIICGYTWVDGAVIGNLPRHSVGLLEDWGRTAGRLVLALTGITVDDAVQTHTWDLINAPAVIRQYVGDVPDAAHRALVLGAVERFETWVTPRIAELPKAVVHQDLNDFNVVVAGTGDAARIAGVIDFGDAILTTRVSEVAIAAAYAMQRKDAPVDALIAVARGYHGVVPLTGAEIATLYPLAVTRLALNATVWTARRHGDTADYGRARSQHTWNTLGRLAEDDAESVAAGLRATLR